MLKLLSPLFTLALVAQAPAPPPPSRPMAPRPPAMQGRPAPAPAPEPADDTLLGTLGKKKITYGDFTKWLKVLAGPRADMVRKNPANRAQAMKQFLDLQILAAKGRKDKLENTAEFKEFLGALKQQAYRQVILDEDRKGSDAQKMKEKAENPTDEELHAYFQANADRYSTPEKFSARHILVSVKTAPTGKGLTDEEAKAKIAKIQEELKAGKKLEDLAKDYSDDPGSKDKGGLYTDIPYGRFAKEFEAAVRTQEPGVVGEPVKTTFGYHLIQVVSRTPKEPADFEKVKDAVKRQMLPERKEKLRLEFMNKIKAEVGYKDAPTAPAPAPAMAPAHVPAPAPAPAPVPPTKAP